MIYDVRDISFTYPFGKRKVLDRISFTLEQGRILTILGPNGAGKSTLLNCMAGLLRPNRGETFVCGQELSSMSFREIARIISYVQQTHTPAFAYSVLHFVTMGLAPKIGLFGKPTAQHRELARKALERLGIGDLAEKPYTEISGGEMQQAIIARAIVHNPKVILFDEPTAHLDYGNQIRVLGLIREMANRGFSVIMTTHNPDHAILVGGIAAILDMKGRIEVGPCEKIITEEKLQRIYKTELRLMAIPELSRMACIPPNL